MMGRAIEQRLKASGMEEGLLQVVRQQAKSFILKLEEKYFFRQYYRDFPDDFLGHEASSMIQMTIEQEKGSITKEVMQELLGKVQEALVYQEELRSLGVKTPMNLYQLLTLKKLLDLQGILLADEMGLGKTLQSLASFLLTKKDEMLVLGPKTVLDRWMDDMGKHLDLPLEVVIVGDFEPKDTLVSNSKVTITKIPRSERYNYILHPRPPTPGRRRIILMNYEILPRLHTFRVEHQLPPIHTDFLALDEAHLLKNLANPTSQEVYGDLEGKDYIQAEYKIVVTGTPLENKPLDMLAHLPIKWLMWHDSLNNSENMIRKD